MLARSQKQFTYALSYQAYCPKREVQRWIPRHTLPQHIHPLIVTNPPTFAYKYLAKCGTAYILGLCVRVIDSLASVTQTHQRVGHTHIHTNRYQPIWYTKTHTHTHIHMYSHSNIQSLACTPVRWTHTYIQFNKHTQTHVNTNTCTITQILINSLQLLGFHKVVKNTLHWLVFWFASVANCE